MKRCESIIKREVMNYCAKGKTDCKYQSKHQMPYVNEKGNLGGRQYECRLDISNKP